MKTSELVKKIENDKKYNGLNEIRHEGYYFGDLEYAHEHTSETYDLYIVGLSQCDDLLDTEYYSGLEYNNGKFKIVVEREHGVEYKDLR